MARVEEAGGEHGHSWQGRFDLILLVAALAGVVSHIAGIISAFQLGIMLALAIALAGAGYLVSILRDDAERPGSTLLLGILLILLTVHEIAFGGAGPRWLQALVLLAVLVSLAPRGDASSAQPLRKIDRPPF